MTERDLTDLTPAELIDGIEANHPAACYVLATKLFGADEKDEAVFWFYAGQLRYRCHLAAHPELEPSGDPALFAAISAQVGETITVYAFGDIPKLAATITRVLVWDAAHPDRFTDTTARPSECEGAHQGLVEMRETILRDQDRIRQQRREAGLE